MNLEQLYRIRCEQPSAIHQHLPTLRKYAEQCNKVTEFGVQGGLSTTSFLAAQPHFVTSYDLEFHLSILNLIDVGKMCYAYSNEARYLFDDTVWTCWLQDVLDANILPTDLLFIDTFHTYEQLRGELHLHHSKVSKWIILHDTESYGEHAEGWQDVLNPSAEQVAGLKRAIGEFLETEGTDWRIKEVSRINNGLTVLERT